MPDNPEPQPLNSIRALLSGVVDYAGLFPPARLELDDAFTKYLQYQGGADSWMLSRFVIRAEQLTDLALQYGRLSQRPQLGLSVLVGGATGTAREAVSHALDEIRMTEEDTSSGVRGDMLETALALRSNLDAADVIGAFQEALTDLNRKANPVFFEAPWRSDSVSDLHGIAVAVRRAREDGFNFGLKIRAGGLSAERFPPAADMARFIAKCLEYDIPFKATAGLHHPIRHNHSEYGVMEHGFVNVMAAAILGRVHQMDENGLLPIIEETSGDAFQISEDGLAWRHLSASSGEIADGRRFFTSFGSCSFDDPRDDLRELGWLPAAVSA